MSKREEKQSAMGTLKVKLKSLGFEKDPATKLLLVCLEPANIPSDLVEAVNNMVSIAVIETKKKVKRSLQELADNL